jgi:hypothetical protein
LILKRNNLNKRLLLDSAETSFVSSFGCFDTKTSLGGHPSLKPRGIRFLSVWRHQKESHLPRGSNSV